MNTRTELEELALELGVQVKQALRIEWQGPISYLLLLREPVGRQKRNVALATNLDRRALIAIARDLLEQLGAKP